MTLFVSPPRKSPLIVGNKVFRPSTDVELTEDDVEKARVELGETEERRNKCLQELKARLSKDNNVNYLTEDEYLLRFLRGKKFDCDKAYQCLKELYHLKKKRPELFATDIKKPKTVEEENILTLLPYSHEDGTLIYLWNIGRWNIQEYPVEAAFSAIFAAADIASLNPRHQINGLYSLWDTRGFSASHVPQLLKNNNLYTFLTVLRKCYPCKMKKSFVVNASPLVRFLYSIIRRTLSKKIADRVIFIGSDYSELHKYINPALLPKSLGGALEEEECTSYQHLQHNIPYLKYERSFV